VKAVDIHIGDSLEDVGRRFADAWHRAERGELTAETAERHVTFVDLETFSRVLSPKRVELLRHVHREPARSVRALALALGRDYRRVHEDVEVLVGSGLLEKGEDGLRAGYDRARIKACLDL
jgi:predicted transcriptional regulator